MWGHVKFIYEKDRAKLDHCEPDHIQPNQGLHHQIAICKPERTQLIQLTNNLLSLCCVYHSSFLKKHNVLEWLYFRHQAKKHLNW
jgi:hypothetical protein